MARDVIIFGASHAARMMRSYLEREGTRRVVGFTIDEEFRSATELDGLPVYGWRALEAHVPPSQADLLGPVTYRHMNTLRRDRHLEAKSRGYQIAGFIHPTAQLYASSVGEGAIILEYAVVQPGVRIGDGFVAWSCTLIGHDCHVGDYCFLSGSVSVGGRTTLGERTYLAGGVQIAPGCTIGAASAVLNGAFIAADLPPRSVVKGRADKPLRVTTDRLHRLL